jgi:hypothetical protein
MSNKIKDYFALAREAAIVSDDREDHRAFLLGAIGERSDGKIVKSRNGSANVVIRRGHAEFRLQKKLDYHATIYVVRIRVDNGRYAMSRPCKTCQKCLMSKKVDKVFYTVNDEQYGIYYPDIDHDIIKKF